MAVGVFQGGRRSAVKARTGDNGSTHFARDTSCRARKGESSASPTLSSAPLAQRQSNGLLIRRFRVQIPGGAPVEQVVFDRHPRSAATSGQLLDVRGTKTEVAPGKWRLRVYIGRKTARSRRICDSSSCPESIRASICHQLRPRTPSKATANNGSAYEDPNSTASPMNCLGTGPLTSVLRRMPATSPPSTSAVKASSTAIAAISGTSQVGRASSSSSVTSGSICSLMPRA